MQALGLIEVIGYPAAIEGADAALKAANIKLNGMSKVGSGIMTVTLYGDVGAVKAAVDASSLAASKVGTLRAAHVIPRVGSGISGLIQKAGSLKTEDDPVENDDGNQVNDTKNMQREYDAGKNSDAETVREGKKSSDSPSDTSEAGNLSSEDKEAHRPAGGHKTSLKKFGEEGISKPPVKKIEELDSYRKKTLTELRNIAASLDIPMDAEDLKNAKKDELIRMILAHQK